MYKPSTYLVVTYFPTYLPIYETYFQQNWVPTIAFQVVFGNVHTMPITRHNGLWVWNLPLTT